MRGGALVRISLGLVVMLAPLMASADVVTGMPFEAGQVPVTFPVEECELRNPDPGLEEPPANYRVKNDPNSPIVRLPFRSSTGEIDMSLLDPKGNRILCPVLISNGRHHETVYHGDLNRDGTEDFVVDMYLDSMLSDRQWSRVAFVLSEQGTYKVTVMQTKSFRPEDLVDYRGDGRCQFVQTLLVYGGEGTDFEYEAFLVDNLFEIRGSEIVEVSDLHPDFPRWSKWRPDPSDDSAVTLTDEQRSRILQKFGRLMFWELDDEYQEALKTRWEKVFDRLESLENSRQSTEEKGKRAGQILKEAYEDTNPVSMSTGEREALETSDGDFSIEEIRKYYRGTENDWEDLVPVLEKIVDFENPSEKDCLFLYRFFTPIGEAIQAIAGG